MLHLSFTQEISNLQIAISKFRNDELRYGLVHLEGIINGALCLFENRELEEINLIREFVENILNDGFIEYKEYALSEALEEDDDDLGEFTINEYGMIQTENSELLMKKYLWFDYSDEEELLFNTVNREDEPDIGRIFTEYKNLTNIKRYELYGALSLNFIYKLLENYNCLSDVINISLKATKAMISATLIKSNSNEFRIENIKNIENNALKTRAKLGALKRHEPYKKVKALVLTEYKTMFRDKTSRGIQPISKDRFADKMAEKYSQVTRDTIRKWLKGQ
ncbi:hypothetical protein PMCNE_18750 [Pasteurella multocida]|uniref:hypothetical protein n=1 Tax=Pasteurella multocida TaxID=747 RepID=UPI0009588A36|nr:hypothetical protein [Pasteurella multocida]APW56595.1 hypothetical protein PMCN07_2018 [Pasteurella multocida subsp. multocida str. HN07]MCL7820929.1 hypothetical protein [Pasteurella multocida]TAA82061.1 hypothetical protein PMCNE_18750 [Pasteurella multocida]WND41908.1 hypothetical protein RHO09_10140 [Pasteurella multocida]